MLKVLVVEDDSSVASLIRLYLEEDGYAPVMATDIEAAWGLLISEDPDALVLDIWLYGNQLGWDLLERVRKNEHFAGLPVVVLTGMGGADVTERAEGLGAEYLNKPFSSAALMDRVRRAIRSAGRSPGTRPVPITLILRTVRVQGDIHVPADLPRFSDGWEAAIRDQREYIPVTNATITSFDGEAAPSQAPLVEVRKADIQAALPREGADHDPNAVR